MAPAAAWPAPWPASGPLARSGRPGAAGIAVLDVNVVDAIRRANQPRPPEDSIRLRVACTGAVLVAIAAAPPMGELSPPTAVAAMGLVPLGMVFSYRHPGPAARVDQGAGRRWRPSPPSSGSSMR